MPKVNTSQQGANTSYVEYIDVFAKENVIPSAGISNQVLCFDTDAGIDPLEKAKAPEGFKLYQKACFYLKKGMFVLEINGKEETISAGHLLTIMPESIVKTIHKNPELEYYATIIYPQLSSLTYRDLGITYSNAQLSQRYFISPMTPEQMQNTYRLYNEIKHDMLQPDYKYQPIFLRSLLNALYVENINIHQDSPMPLYGDGNSRQYDIYCKFLTALNKHAQEHRNVLYYANLLGISSKYLSYVCISYSKKNASTWIDDAVIQKAKVLMTVHQYNVQKVAEMLNFQTTSSFRRFFKRVTSITASEYLTAQNNTH